MIKPLAIALMFAVGAAATVFPDDASARRLGGGGGIGMQRSVPPRAAPESVPARPATAPNANAASPAPRATAAAPTATAAAAAAPRRSWLGPLAGVAAGIGLAALLGHMGLGGALADAIMLALFALAAIVAVRFLIRRFAPSAARTPSAVGAGAGSASLRGRANAPASWRTANEVPSVGTGAGHPSIAAAAAASVPSVPASFDSAGFERIAKLIFIRMQAANDAGDLADLRAFTTPEMFAAVKLDLNERAGAAQRTDVVRVDAEVLDVATEGERQVVSVRFHGLVREQRDGTAEPFDEVWHLVRPLDGSREWAIAGIQQQAAHA